MSPNPFDLDLAIQDLRSERSESDRRERSLNAVLRPRRTRLKLTGLAVAATIAVTLLMLIPTRGSGLAWSAVLRRTQGAENLHILTTDDSGRVIREQWRSGAMWAAWGKDKTGRIVNENRSDRRHFYTYLYRKEWTSPNATQYGIVWNQTPQMLAGQSKFSGPYRTIATLLSGAAAKLISQSKAELNGLTVQRYVLKLYGEEKVVDADPKSGRILVLHDKGETSKFDYPDFLDPKLFSFEARFTRDVAVSDQRGEEDPKKMPPYMPKPIASKGAIRLRAVSLSGEGDLYFFWTGYLPDKNTSSGLRVLGIKTGKTLWLGYSKDGIHPVTGPHNKRLVCYRVELLEKIGDRVSIRIPTPTSYVVFKDVPIKRLQPLRE